MSRGHSYERTGTHGCQCDIVPKSIFRIENELRKKIERRMRDSQVRFVAQQSDLLHQNVEDGYEDDSRIIKNTWNADPRVFETHQKYGVSDRQPKKEC